MTEQEFKQRCVPIESIFLTGIEDIDNNPKLKKMREDILSNKQNKEAKSLYIVEFEDGNVKIGVSKNPEKRLKTIENNSGRKIKNFYVSEKIENSFKVEANLKNKLKQYNLNGEFYNLRYTRVLKLAKDFLKKE